MTTSKRFAHIFLALLTIAVLVSSVATAASRHTLRDAVSTTRAHAASGPRRHIRGAWHTFTLCSTVLRQHDEDRVPRPIEQHCRHFLARRAASRHKRHLRPRPTAVTPPPFPATVSAPRAAALAAHTLASPIAPTHTATAKPQCIPTAHTTGCVSRAVSDLVPALLPAGTAHIKGTVTSAGTGKPIQGIEACASNEEAFECAITGVNGEYDIPNLAAGTYRVSFVAPFESELNYLYQYYNNKSSYVEATPVAVTSGGTVSPINASMHEGGQIAGKVTDAKSKVGIEGIQACAYGTGAEEFVEACAKTNASGEYHIRGLVTDSFKVAFSRPYNSALNYLPQYYNGKSTYEEAEPVSVTAGTTTSGINAALSEGAQITGRVTDASTKAAIAKIFVCVSGTAIGGCSETNASGEYDIGGLVTGQYRVEFQPTFESGLNYLRQYYNGMTNYYEATLVPATVGATTSGIDAAMQPGARISGTVTSAATKEALGEVMACASENGGEFIERCSLTNSKGEYTIVGLPTGNYIAAFISSGGPYAPQYYNGKVSSTEATTLSLTAGTLTPNVNAAMQVGAEISGKVTNANTKAALAHIVVCPLLVNASASVSCSATNENGEYTLTKLPAGEYHIEFAIPYASNLNFLRQYYNGKGTVQEANIVAVATGGSATGIDAALHEGGTIAGTVTSTATKAPLSEIEVCAEATSGELLTHCARTEEHGKYSVTGLSTASYRVRFSSPTGEYALQYYNGKSFSPEAEPVSATAGSVTSGIDAAMAPVSAISGVVTSTATKTAAANVEVCALQASTGSFIQCASTNTNGEYAISTLSAGEYKVEFGVGSGTSFMPQYYNGKGTFAEATIIALATAETRSEINAALQAGGEFSGTVTDGSTSQSVAGIEVCGYKETGEFIYHCATTNASGEYTVVGLPSGEYVVEFFATGHNYLTQFYNGKINFNEADQVSVTLGSTTSGIDAALKPGGIVTGTVKAAATSTPVSNIDVCASPRSGGASACAVTNAGGEYSIVGLATGEYTVAFYGNGQNYVPQSYNGKAKPTEATAVSVAAGSTTPNIDASLEVGGEITGTVTTAKTKEPVGNVTVGVYETNGAFVTNIFTNPKGEYTALGLATGEYKVLFSTGSQEYKAQYYNNKESLSAATAVAVTAGGHVTPGIDAALAIAPPVLMTSPTISGKDQEGVTLTEAHGFWKNGPTEYTYQWLRCEQIGFNCVKIEHATSQTYPLVFADVGHTIRVEETAHNETGASTPATSTQTELIAVAPPENSKAPTIAGTAQQGKTLNAVAGSWTNEPTKAKLQWLHCDAKGGECKAIASATSSSYVPVAEDVGHTVRVEETAENAAGPSNPASSQPSAVIVPPIPVNTALPKIAGTAQQGKELKQQQGSWEYSPTEREYQWIQCNNLGEGCMPIPGATEQIYVPRPEDVGHTLRIEEYARNAGGTGGPATSAHTAEVLPAPPTIILPPTIAGTAQQGRELTEGHGIWENLPTSYRYEWLRCNNEGGACAAIKGAAEAPYAALAADVGHTLRVAEIAKNAGGSSEPVDSEPTAIVLPPAPVLKSAPTVAGVAKQGRELTLHHGAWEYSPTAYEDKWLRCGSTGESCEFTGETGESYKLANGDVGHTMRIEEVAINEGGSSTSATSEPTGIVLNAVPENETPPTIAGTAQQGSELTLQRGQWTNEPTGYEDQWLRCNESGGECQAITGTQETQYTPTKEDVDHVLRVEETARNEGGKSTPSESLATAIVLPEAPVDSTPPTITGEAVQGLTLTEQHGGWEGSPTAYEVHWLQCSSLGEGCLPIVGAEGETYKPNTLDVGHTIRVEETASNAGGKSEPATSAATALVNSAAPIDISPPTVTGTAQKGETLAAQPGSWSNEPTGYTYQWLLCSKEATECSPISGAVDPTLLATSADVGHTLEVEVLAGNAGGESEPATSTATAAVAPVPLTAAAGEAVTAVAGAAVSLDGSGSSPAGEIDKYTWEFGDGATAESVNVTHAYAEAGTYTATLTVNRGTETASTSVTVSVTPAPAHAPVVEITDSGHGALPGATVTYIGPGNVRIQGTTDAEGKASLPGIPNGRDTVYAYKSGFQPAVGHVHVNGGAGETTIALASGEVATSTLVGREMTLKEIEAAGINVNNPENQNVYEFEVRLAFIETPEMPQIEFKCYINNAGEFVGHCTGGGGSGGGAGGGGWFGSGGGGGPSGPGCSPHACVGGGIVAIPHIVNGHPLIQWLILRGKVTVLKQFFEVTQVVQNLSPEPFNLAAGSATLNLPAGMSLAPTATPQSATQSVPEIPGGGSSETNWIVRGDKPGEYLLSANYASYLEPFGPEAPVEIEARLASPLRVWGVEALSLSVKAEQGFLAEGQPYRVRVTVTNKSEITLNNVEIDIFRNVHERFIFQPDQRFSEAIAELKPGQSVSAPLDVLVPDAPSEAAFNPALSSVHFVGEEIHPGQGIETAPTQPLYPLTATTEAASKRVHLAWATDPNAEGYEVFSTPTLDTPFPEVAEEVSPVASGKPIAVLPAGDTEAYAPYVSNESEKYYTVTSIVKGIPTLDHPVVLASFGSGAEDWGYCFEAALGVAYGSGTANGSICLVQSGDGGRAYVMTHGSAAITTPLDLTTLGTSLKSLVDIAGACAAQGSVSVGAIAFEGPVGENPAEKTYGVVDGSVGVTLPFTHFGVFVDGALMQSRDLSTFGISYAYGASAGLGCLPSPVTVTTDPEYKYHFTELTGAARTGATALLSTLTLSFWQQCPIVSLECTLASVQYIGSPAISFVKKYFPGLYVSLSAATSPPSEPQGVSSWTSSSSGSNTEVATATTGDGTLEASSRGIGSLAVGRYSAVPQGLPALQVGSTYFDTAISKESLFNVVTITDCQVPAGTSTVQWWNPAANAWQPVSNAVFTPGPPECVTITAGPSTSPSLAELTGTVFAAVPASVLCSANPAIEAQPGPATVTEPGEASFSVKEGAIPAHCSAAAIQWEVSNNGGANFAPVGGAEFSGTTLATLRDSPTNTAESGHEFRAVLTNAHGSTASSAATLTVNEAGGANSGGSTVSGGPSQLSSSSNPLGEVKSFKQVQATKPPTQPQKLARALKACKKLAKRKRAQCEKAARKRYAAKHRKPKPRKHK